MGAPARELGSDQRASGRASAPSSAAALAALSKALKQQASAVDAVRKAIDPPAPGKLAAARAQLTAGRDAAAAVADPAPALDAWLDWERAGRRQTLSDALRTACAERGIPLAVVTREPLELRLSPVAARIDTDADRAEIQFARETLQTCGAQADAVLAARDKAVAELEQGAWDPAAFLGLLRRAWRRASPGGDWAELVDVLPELVLLRQSKRFRAEPTARNFAPYSRARFAYDLWRLRRDRALAADGWRLSLGPATGGSTKDKKRVLWLEDADGRGQYHLTLRFVPEDDRA